MVVGSTLSFLQNGVERIAVYDNSLVGGAPGIMAFGAGMLDNWSGGSAGFEAHYLSTDANGVQSYDSDLRRRRLRTADPQSSSSDEIRQPGSRTISSLCLPVEPGLGAETPSATALRAAEAANAQNRYNLTIIEPSFEIDPWYANNPNDANLQYESFMTAELLPWVKANLATTGTEQSWLIGFSKSGIGAEDLLLKHPDLFTLAATWDFPADMSSYDQYGASSANNYGTDANFQANYRLSTAFLDAHKASFCRHRPNLDRRVQRVPGRHDGLRLAPHRGRHRLTPPRHRVLRWPISWGGGWVPTALAALGAGQSKCALSLDPLPDSDACVVVGLAGEWPARPGRPSRAWASSSA